MKDKLWWYGAYRHQYQNQNYAVLIDATAHIHLPIRSFKVTYQLSQNNKLSGYYTRGHEAQRQLLDPDADRESRPR